MDAVYDKHQEMEEFTSINFEKSDQLLKMKKYITEKNWSRASMLAEEITEMEANNPEFLFGMAEIKTESQDYPGALNIYHEMLDILEGQDPMCFDIYKNMGNIYLKCGDIDAAEEKYNQAHAINSQDESLSINYGVLYIQKGEYSNAKNRFADVLTKNNESDFAWVGMGLVHRAHADHELARACLLRGLDENPYNKLAITNYYTWCDQDGKEASIEHINNFLQQYPQDQEIKRLQQGLSQ